MFGHAPVLYKLKTYQVAIFIFFCFRFQLWFDIPGDPVFIRGSFSGFLTGFFLQCRVLSSAINPLYLGERRERDPGFTKSVNTRCFPKDEILFYFIFNNLSYFNYLTIFFHILYAIMIRMK